MKFLLRVALTSVALLMFATAGSFSAVPVPDRGVTHDTDFENSKVHSQGRVTTDSDWNESCMKKAGNNKGEQEKCGFAPLKPAEFKNADSKGCMEESARTSEPALRGPDTSARVDGTRGVWKAPAGKTAKPCKYIGDTEKNDR